MEKNIERYVYMCITDSLCCTAEINTVNQLDFKKKIMKYNYTSLLYLTEKAMAPHSSTLAWKIPWMEEAGRL